MNLKLLKIAFLSAFVFTQFSPLNASAKQSSISVKSLQPVSIARMCATGYYKNSKGSCVHSPTKAPAVPAGASAQCADKTYSFSQSRRGTCSHHGGVARWL